LSDIKVTCVCCKTEYPALWDDRPEAEQAYECAATIFGDKLVGHYGSVVADMQLHIFKGGRPDHIPEGTVCDKCILKFQADGILEFQRDGVW
jgi:hypothetical protein